MTYHQSSIYIRDDLLSKLNNAANLLDMKRSRLIEALLIKFMDNTKGGEKTWKMLKYQKIDKGAGAAPICIFWRFDVYERSCDVKKAYKMSVSFVIAVAIENYLDELVREILDRLDKEGTYNYNTFYMINAHYHENSFIYTTVWNNPGPEILWKVTNL